MTTHPTIGTPKNLSLTIFAIHRGRKQHFGRTTTIRRVKHKDHVRSHSNGGMVVQTIPRPCPMVTKPYRHPRGGLPKVLPHQAIRESSRSKTSLLNNTNTNSKCRNGFVPPNRFFLARRKLTTPNTTRTNSRMPFYTRARLYKHDTIRTSTFFPFIPGGHPLRGNIQFPIETRISFRPREMKEILPVRSNFFPIIVRFRRFPALTFRTRKGNPIHLNRTGTMLTKHVKGPYCKVHRKKVRREDVHNIFRNVLQLVRPQTMVNTTRATLFVFTRNRLKKANRRVGKVQDRGQRA